MGNQLSRGMVTTLEISWLSQLLASSSCLTNPKQERTSHVTLNIVADFREFSIYWKRLELLGSARGGVKKSFYLGTGLGVGVSLWSGPQTQ